MNKEQSPEGQNEIPIEQQEENKPELKKEESIVPPVGTAVEKAKPEPVKSEQSVPKQRLLVISTDGRTINIARCDLSQLELREVARQILERY